MTTQQIDFEVSRLRTLGSFTLACGFCAGCIWLLYARPVTATRSIEPGSFAEFVMMAGIPLFGFAAVAALIAALRPRRVLVSVGPQGLFDRRLSTDWIPWHAVSNVMEYRLQKQKWVVVQLDPTSEPMLPLHDKVRAAARRPRPFGPDGFYLAGSHLVGGFKAFSSAVAQACNASAARA